MQRPMGFRTCTSRRATRLDVTPWQVVSLTQRPNWPETLHGARRVYTLSLKSCSSRYARHTHLRQNQTRQSTQHRRQWSQESPRDWRHTPRTTWPSSDSRGSTADSPSAAVPRPPPTERALRRRVSPMHWLVSPVHWRQEAGRGALLPTQIGGAAPIQQPQRRSWRNWPRQRGRVRESSGERNQAWPSSGSTWSCPRQSQLQPS